MYPSSGVASRMVQIIELAVIAAARTQSGARSQINSADTAQCTNHASHSNAGELSESSAAALSRELRWRLRRGRDAAGCECLQVSLVPQARSGTAGGALQAKRCAVPASGSLAKRAGCAGNALADQTGGAC
jgi:hypothetical protein